MPKIAAWLCTIVAAGLTVFQLALAAGALWGDFAMGGAFPGQFPPAMWWRGGINVLSNVS